MFRAKDSAKVYSTSLREEREGEKILSHSLELAPICTRVTRAKIRIRKMGVEMPRRNPYFVGLSHTLVCFCAHLAY